MLEGISMALITLTPRKFCGGEMEIPPHPSNTPMSAHGSTALTSPCAMHACAPTRGNGRRRRVGRGSWVLAGQKFRSGPAARTRRRTAVESRIGDIIPACFREARSSRRRAGRLRPLVLATSPWPLGDGRPVARGPAL